MPRGGRGGGGRGGSPGGARRDFSSQPPARSPPPSSPPANRRTVPDRPGVGGGGGGGTGMFGVIAGSFLGSAVGTVVGDAIASSMFAGRDPDTGEYTDKKLADDNPCKKELDYFLECSKYVDDPSLCKGPLEGLKKCAEKHKDYYEAASEEE